jgi:hypothetical protein
MTTLEKFFRGTQNLALDKLPYSTCFFLCALFNSCFIEKFYKFVDFIGLSLKICKEL